MTLRPDGQIDMIQLHWEIIFLSHQCVTVFAGWSFRTVWNITYLSKCIFNPLMTSDEYTYLWIPIIVTTFLSMAQPMKLGTNSPNLCHHIMQIILFWTWRKYRKLVLYTKVKLTSNLFFLNCTYPRNAHIINVIPTTLCPCPIYKVQTIFRVHILFCD